MLCVWGVGGGGELFQVAIVEIRSLPFASYLNCIKVYNAGPLRNFSCLKLAIEC